MRLRRETDRRYWVTAVVAIWGHYTSGTLEENRVVYLHGDELASWLSSGTSRTTLPEERGRTLNSSS
jgi:hypothetical protein